MKKENGLIIILCICLVGVIFWPFKRSTSMKTLKIGISLYQQDDPFIDQLSSEIKKSISILEREDNYRIIFECLDAKNSQNIQNQQISYFFKQDYDVLLVNLVDVTVASKMISQAKSKDVPMIFFNRELSEADLNLWDKISYVGTSGKATGLLEAKIILDTYKIESEVIDKNNDGRLDYIIVEGEEGHADSIYRTNVILNELEKEFKLYQLSALSANWLRKNAYQKATMISNDMFNQCEVLICHNDDMALGIVDYLKEINYQGRWPTIIGVNGMEEVKQLINDNLMLGTVSLQMSRQAEKIIDLVKQMVIEKDYEEIEKIYYIEPKIFSLKINS